MFSDKDDRYLAIDYTIPKKILLLNIYAPNGSKNWGFLKKYKDRHYAI